VISAEKADHIRSLANSDGHIEPAQVVADARNPKSVLHDEFNWDVNSAAEEHWLDVARGLIRFVRLKYEIADRVVLAPYFVPDPHREPRSRRYVDLVVAGRDRNLAQQIMANEMDRIIAAVRRAQNVADVLNLRAELDELLENVMELKTASEQRRDEAVKKKAKTKVQKKKPPRRDRPEARP
jgi:hypothetical protein